MSTIRSEPAIVLVLTIAGMVRRLGTSGPRLCALSPPPRASRIRRNLPSDGAINADPDPT